MMVLLQIMVPKQLPQVGIELAALGLLEKSLDLSPREVRCFLVNPGVIEALHSDRYSITFKNQTPTAREIV